MVKHKQKKIIVLADASCSNRAILQGILEDEFQIRETVNSEQTIEMMEKEGKNISLILLNISLQKEDSSSILFYVHQHQWNKIVPIISILEEDAQEKFNALYEDDIFDFIKMSTEPQIIKHRVRSAIRLFTRQRKIIEQIEQQNNHLSKQNEKLHYIDSLTGCLNFEAFKMQASRLIREESGKKYALSYCDIKRFKFINDEFGYEVGDHLIRHWAEAIKNDLGEDEIIGRVSADNMIVLSHYEQEEELYERIRKRTASVEGFLREREKGYDIEIVIGVYLVKEEEKKEPKISHMLDCANVAQKSVKKLNGSQIAFYSKKMWEQQVREQEIRQHLRLAMAHGEIEVWFQPQFDYSNHKFVGAEALARWNHPELGAISPAEFIPILEKSGLIYEFDQYIWEETCKHLRYWMDKYGKKFNIALSVNVSRLDINAVDFYEKLEKMLDKYEIPHHLLWLEITENAYMDEPEQLIEAVTKLQDMGFIVEMDDFGSGYSSLNMLKDVNINILKMDMRFLDDRENGFRGGMILNSIMQMSQWLELPVIAEGVETKEQADFLKNMGCEMMQGYYFSRPLCAEQFEQILPGFGESRINTDFHGNGLHNIMEFLDNSSKSSFIFNECIGGAVLMEFNGHTSNANAILINDAFFDATGITTEEWENYRIRMLDAFHQESKEIVLQAIRESVEKGYAISEIQMKRNHRWIKCHYRCLSSGKRGQIIFVQVEDVTSLHEMSEEVRRLEQEQKWKQTMYQKLAEIPGMITYDYNPKTDQMTMHICKKDGKMKSIQSNKFFDCLPEQDWIHPDSVEIIGKTYKEALKTSQSGIVEFKGRFFGENYRWMRSYYTSVADENGRVYRLVGRADDIEEDVQSKNNWMNKAQRDTMTNLFNHDTSIQQVASSLEAFGGGILMILDIDDFKRVNDVLGHLQGDMVLVGVADAIRRIFRKGDILGRFGGDEFIIFMPGVKEEALAGKKARSILKEVSRINLPEMETTVKCSVGISVAHSGRVAVKSLFEQADVALYEVKQKGKGSYAIYNKKMQGEPRMQLNRQRES